MTTLYVYDPETMLVIARITGADNTACERVATDTYGDAYSWTYSPAFGATDGLIDDNDAPEIEA